MSSNKDVRDGEGFLSRWSRLKRTGDEDGVAEALQTEQLAAGELTDQKQPLDAATEQPPVLTDDDMPPIESLTEDSDYSGFMSPGVSEELRQLALRKLFRSAAFNVCDGLDDYDDDYTSFEKLGDIITADMRFQMEQEAKRKMEAMLEDDGHESVETDIEDQTVPEDKALDASEALDDVPAPEGPDDYANDEVSYERDYKSPQQPV